MTNEEYAKEINTFLKKTKIRNDQKIKHILKWRLDTIELAKKTELVENFRRMLTSEYKALQRYFADTYDIDVHIKEGEDGCDIEDLYIEGKWIEK